MTQEKKRLGLAVPQTLHKKLVEKAEYQGKTINALCLDIFWEYFEPSKLEQVKGKQVRRWEG